MGFKKRFDTIVLVTVGVILTACGGQATASPTPIEVAARTPIPQQQQQHQLLLPFPPKQQLQLLRLPRQVDEMACCLWDMGAITIIMIHIVRCIHTT